MHWTKTQSCSQVKPPFNAAHAAHWRSRLAYRGYPNSIRYDTSLYTCYFTRFDLLLSTSSASASSAGHLKPKAYLGGPAYDSRVSHTFVCQVPQVPPAVLFLTAAA